MSFLQQNDVVLFQGDSVTDCGRDRIEQASLGYGYPDKINRFFRERYGAMNITVINKGVSGDRTLELLNRWDADCLELTPRPTVVSILVGVNDCWHRYATRFEHTTAGAFEAHYRDILAETRETLCARIIIMEPYIVQNDPEMDCWREDLDPKIHAVRRLAREFGALYIPLDGIFAAAAIKDGPDAYAPDGVHPSDRGHKLIAEAWLKSVGLL